MPNGNNGSDSIIINNVKSNHTKKIKLLNVYV